MKTARVFNSGNSQAVRLPKEFRFAAKEVEIFRRGTEVVLRESQSDLGRVAELLGTMPEDFMAEGRRDTPPEQREGL